jgi:hypothetical protein
VIPRREIIGSFLECVKSLAGSAGILAGEFLAPALEHAGKGAGAPGEAAEVPGFTAQAVSGDSFLEPTNTPTP